MKFFIFLVCLTCVLSEFLIGSASESILPKVNGRRDYWKKLSENDTNSPGTFVEKFDAGQIGGIFQNIS